jgi:selenocysteine-specific elongation factor
VPGERFVVRNAQALRTIGGGRVLDPFGPARKRRSAQRKAWLDSLVRFLDCADPALLVAHNPTGVRRSLLTRLTLLPAAQCATADDVIEIALRGDDALLISRTGFDQLCERVLDVLREFHVRFPDEIGPSGARLKRMVEPELDDTLWRALIDALCNSTRLIQNGAWLHLPEHSVELQPQEQVLAEALIATLHAAAFDPPWVRDLAREFNSTELIVRDLLRKLALRGETVQIVRDLFCHPARVAELLQLMATIAQQQTGSNHRYVDAASFRDASGLGRKRAIQFLEFFDRVGYTRRLRDVHVLRAEHECRA